VLASLVVVKISIWNVLHLIMTFLLILIKKNSGDPVFVLRAYPDDFGISPDFYH